MTRFIARALAVVLACALVFAVVRAGQTYFFCGPAGAVASHACCAAAKCPQTSPTLEHGACCQALALDDLRMVHASPAPDVAAAPWLAVLPEGRLLPHLAGAPISTSRIARAAPPPRPPTPSFLRVYLI